MEAPYIGSAEISAVSSLGEAGSIEATIGLKTSRTTLSSLIEDIEKNATGQKAYSLVNISEDQLARLTLIRGLMRAVPWEHIDPPDPPDISGWIADIEKAIVGALEEVYRALVNALSAAMSTVSGVLRGVASAFASGVRMLVAGIMAVVDFVAKLFSDLLLLLREFGQWFIGVFAGAMRAIINTMKAVLRWISWVILQMVKVGIEIIKQITKALGIAVGGDFGEMYKEVSTGTTTWMIYVGETIVATEVGDLYGLNITITTSTGEAKYGIAAEIPTLPIGGSYRIINKTATTMSRTAITMGQKEEKYSWAEITHTQKYGKQIETLLFDASTVLGGGAIGLASAALVAEQIQQELARYMTMQIVINIFFGLYFGATLLPTVEVLDNGTILDLVQLQAVTDMLFRSATAIVVCGVFALAASRKLAEREEIQEKISKIVLGSSAVILETLIVWWLTRSKIIPYEVLPMVEVIIDYVEDALQVLCDFAYIGVFQMSLVKSIELHVLFILPFAMLALFNLLLTQSIGWRIGELQQRAAMDIPSMRIEPQNILPEPKKLCAEIEVTADNIANPNDTIDKVVVDIAKPGGGYYPYEDAHIEIQNATHVINLVRLEKSDQTHYVARVFYDPISSKWLNTTRIEVGGHANLTFNASGYKYGWVYIEIPTAGEITIRIWMNSTTPFPEFSNSIVVWVRDASECEAAERKYYDPPETETAVRGLSPHTNRTDSPWERLEWPYSKVIRINNEYYVPSTHIVLAISLHGNNITFKSEGPSFYFAGGPLHAYLSIPTKYWDSLCEASPFIIRVDGEYWGCMELLRVWFFQHPKVIVSLAAVVAAVVFVVWKRKQMCGPRK